MNGKVTVDQLAQVIRTVDGGHSLGAAALAEAILEALPHLQPTKLEGLRLRDELRERAEPVGLAEQQGVELPPLPPVDGYDKRVHGHYSAEQMRDYARDAIRSAKKEQAFSGLGIDKMAKELLEQHTVAVPVAVEDGRCFMVREQDALDAIRAALAATGKQQVGEALMNAVREHGSKMSNSEIRQQVGEVQGDAAELLAEMRDVEDYFKDVDPNPIHLATVQAAIEALAARQPGVQVPTNWYPIEQAPKDNKRPLFIAQFDDEGKLIEMDWDAIWEAESESWELPQVYYVWMSANGRVEEPTHFAYMDTQGIDLGRALEIMWNWQEQLGGHVFDARDVARTLTSSDMQAIAVDARVCIDATNRNQAIVLAKREIVRALIDGRHAAPGVG